MQVREKPDSENRTKVKLPAHRAGNLTAKADGKNEEVTDAKEEIRQISAG